MDCGPPGSSVHGISHLGRVLQRLGAGGSVETESWVVRRLLELGPLLPTPLDTCFYRKMNANPLTCDGFEMSFMSGSFSNFIWLPGSPGESGLVSRGSQGLRSPLESRRGSLGAP